MIGDARAALQLVEIINTLLGDKVTIDIQQLQVRKQYIALYFIFHLIYGDVVTLM